MQVDGPPPIFIACVVFSVIVVAIYQSRENESTKKYWGKKLEEKRIELAKLKRQVGDL